MDDFPNRWSVLIDLTKQLVTVSAGVLAVVATFAISGPTQLSSTEQWLLGGGLAFLLATTLAGLLSHALTISVLKAKEESATADIKRPGNAAAAVANGSFYAFGGALLLLLLFGVIRAQGSAVDASQAVKLATDFLVGQSKIKGHEDWVSVEKVTGPSGSWHEVKYLTDKGKSWTCTVETSRPEIRGCR